MNGPSENQSPEVTRVELGKRYNVCSCGNPASYMVDYGPLVRFHCDRCVDGTLSYGLLKNEMFGESETHNE